MTFVILKTFIVWVSIPKRSVHRSCYVTPKRVLIMLVPFHSTYIVTHTFFPKRKRQKSIGSNKTPQYNCSTTRRVV